MDERFFRGSPWPGGQAGKVPGQADLLHRETDALGVTEAWMPHRGVTHGINPTPDFLGHSRIKWQVSPRKSGSTWG